MCNNFNKKFLDEAAKAMKDNEFDKVISHDHFMSIAIDIAINGMIKNEGGPFGCVIVKDGKIIGKGNNKVTSTFDPTAHAEIIAIREACKTLNSFQLKGCIVYSTCEPCPMCLGAIYWAKPEEVYFVNNREDASEIEFDDSNIYKEISLPYHKRNIKFEQINNINADKAFKIWSNKENKIKY